MLRFVPPSSLTISAQPPGCLENENTHHHHPGFLLGWFRLPKNKGERGYRGEKRRKRGVGAEWLEASCASGYTEGD